jgi:hypothetical protein
MDTTVDALKALYVALGGTAADVANITLIPDMINAIATVAATATAPELPKVTSSNNGQVLTVDGGKWKAKALPEG